MMSSQVCNMVRDVKLASRGVIAVASDRDRMEVLRVEASDRRANRGPIVFDVPRQRSI